MKIPGIYVEIKGDTAQLKKDLSGARQHVTEQARGMSEAINNSLAAPQIKSSLNSLISNLSTLSNSSKVTGQAFKGLGVDLGQLRSVTGMTEKEFNKLQSQLLKTQAAKVQENALRGIGKAAGLTEREIAALGRQFGLSERQIKNVSGSTNKMGREFSQLLSFISPVIIGLAAGGAAMRALTGEFTKGLGEVERFNLSVASSAAFITTFSDRVKNGDLVGGFREANEYAGKLNEKLEMIDSQTIASGKDLQVISETMLQYGVLLDINNQKQIDGFTNIATALSLVTAGQNKDIQMRQEINALLMGQIRATDRLPKLLSAIDPKLKEHLAQWKEEGVLIEKVGGLLEGFSASTGNLDNSWATVGSTMETIHNRILRGMLEPVFDDLISLAKDLNQSLMDANGNLTPLATGMIRMFNDAYAAGKSFFDQSDEGLISMLGKVNLVTAGFRLMMGLASESVEAIEAYGSTSVQNAAKELEAAQEQLKTAMSGDKEWYQFSLFKDPVEEKRNIDEITAKIERLKGVLASATDAENEFARERARMGGGTTPRITAAKVEKDESKASNLNAVANAEIELIKAAEEKKIAIVKAALAADQAQNENAYNLGLSSYQSYLAEKQALTEKALKADLDLKKKELDLAEAAVGQIKQITDKEGNVKVDQTEKARLEALKKVEAAQKAVIEAESQLSLAQISGAQASTSANISNADSYADIRIQIMEMTGDYVGAAKLQAELDEQSIERKRLILAAEEGVAGAAQALADARLRSEMAVSRVGLENLARSKQAQLATAELDGEYRKSLDIQADLLDIEIQRAELMGALPEEIALLKQQRQEIEKMKQPLSAFVKGWQDVIKEQKTAAEKMYDLSKQTATDMQETFADVFFLAMKGDFEDIGDAFEKMAERMLDRFLAMIAEMVAAWAAAGIAGMFTGQGLGGFTVGALTGTGGSGGGGVGGSVVNAAGSAVVDYAAKEYLGMSVSDYAMTEIVTPIIESITGVVAGSGTAAAIAAGQTSISIAAGNATPAILDAYVVGEAAAAAAAAQSAATAGATATGTGTVGTMTPALMEASVGTGVGTATAAVAGGFVALPAMLFAIGQMVGNDQGMRMNNAGVRPEDLLGAGLIDTLTLLKGEQGFGGISEVLGNLEDNMGQYAAASYSAADSTAILASAQRGEGGLIDSMQFTAVVFDEASGQWVQQTGLFQDMMREMERLGPVTSEAISVTSAYVAEMYGIPSAADELALAFTGVGDGIYNLADVMGGAAYQMSGIVSEAHAALSSIYSRGEDSIHGAKQDEWMTEINNIKGHAAGGTHYGGWRIVGERGPELEYTPPSRIFSNSDSKKILAGASPGQPVNLTIPISVGNEPLTTLMVRVADGVAAVRQRQGVTGGAYI